MVGFDGIPATTLITPQLTTVHQPMAEKGRGCFKVVQRKRAATNEGTDEAYHSPVKRSHHPRAGSGKGDPDTVRRPMPGYPIPELADGLTRVIAGNGIPVVERKFFKNNHLKVGISARGGLEPAFRVLFSAIFQGVTLGNFHQGRNLWK